MGNSHWCPRERDIFNNHSLKSQFFLLRVDRKIVNTTCLYMNPQMPQQQLPPIDPDKVMGRYKDGYRVASIITGLGGFCKVLGIIFAVIVGGGFLVAQGERAMRGGLLGGGYGYRSHSFDVVVLLFICIVGAGIVWLTFYLAGVMISAQGQILKANLDTAVNTSPFLDYQRRAIVMKLI